MNIEKSTISLGEFFGASNYVRWGILISVSIIFTILLYPNLVIKEQAYRVGDVARGNIKATKEYLLEDKEAT